MVEITFFTTIIVIIHDLRLVTIIIITKMSNTKRRLFSAAYFARLITVMTNPASRDIRIFQRGVFMKYGLKHVVFEEMFQATGGCIPAEAELFTEFAHRSKDVAVLLPFYMYFFHPREWQEYTIFTDDALPATLNHAACIALGSPALYADQKIKRYFYGAASVAPLPEDRQTALAMKEWGCCIFREYQLLVQRTLFLANHTYRTDRPSQMWLIKTTGRGPSNGYTGTG